MITASALVSACWQAFIFPWLAPLLWIWHRSFCNQSMNEESRLAAAQSYTEWKDAAEELDSTTPVIKSWMNEDQSRYYDYEKIQERRARIEAALKHRQTPLDGPQPDWASLEHLLRSGLVRNLGNITRDKLFENSYSGTKLLIKGYVESMVNVVRKYVSLPPPDNASMMFRQNLLRTARRSYGGTALVLQGGSIFGICHIGVMKALQKRKLLPNVIVGTASGALMAALVGVHTNEELPQFLNGAGINVTAFAQSRTLDVWSLAWLKRFFASGYVLKPQTVEQCVRANVGDVTFREAYSKTGRALCITISSDNPSVPNCLNHITTPDVLIRTAAMASNESDPVAASSQILEKHKGEIIPWYIASSANEAREHWSPALATRLQEQAAQDNNTPLNRIVQLFNVNHFIISQARPYLLPLLAPRKFLPLPLSPASSRTDSGGWALTRLLSPTAWLKTFTTFINKETTHRLRMLQKLSLLPPQLSRYLLDEQLPPFSSITLVPDVSWAAFGRLTRRPTQEEVDYWIFLGERSVWPNVAALKVRCDIEKALEAGIAVFEERAKRGRERARERAESLGRGGGNLRSRSSHVV